MYITFQYLTVSSIPATGSIHDILIPDGFMYLLQVTYIVHFNTEYFSWLIEISCL